MIKETVDVLVYSLMGLEKGAPLADALHFFIYDSAKILILLYFMIFVIGILRSYISQKRLKEYLSRKGIFSYVFAALFGAVTPFCSCSSIPIFIGLIEAGAPLGAAFTFLITSPLINEYLVVLMLGFFGPWVTGIYVFFGLALGILVGLLAARMGLDKHLVKDLYYDAVEVEKTYKNFGGRIRYGLNEASSITRMLWKWVFLGVGIGAVIHGFVPQELIQSWLDTAGAFSVPIAVLLGVPVYASCAAIVPVAVVLFEKGVPLGTAIAFMMASSALSIPGAVILRRVMRLRLIMIFFALTTLGIILAGYLMNAAEGFLLT
ncbi:MAG: permease [Candidatus Altiarchaeota archaeon]|nr:permease [Candidatus Altiarchaeota archaeon]